VYEEVIYEVTDPVASITLNRPEKLNALTRRTIAEVRDAVTTAAHDPSVFGIVVTGAGRGFCSGLDSATLTESVAQGRSGWEDRPDETPGLFTWLLAVDKPVIAAVNGVAAGGGFVLATMSDVRFASTAASFTTIFSKRGLISEHGTSWIVPRLVGAGRALDLLWTSKRIDAQEAYRIGLVEYLVEPDDLLPAARRYIAQMADEVSAASVKDIKRLVYSHLGLGYDAALREADDVQWASLERPDATEGALSLAERRPAVFPRLGKEK
jgi:enoyl-CoA hydratase/carnithine racemase